MNIPNALPSSGSALDCLRLLSIGECTSSNSITALIGICITLFFTSSFGAYRLIDACNGGKTLLIRTPRICSSTILLSEAADTSSISLRLTDFEVSF